MNCISAPEVIESAAHLPSRYNTHRHLHLPHNHHAILTTTTTTTTITTDTKLLLFPPSPSDLDCTNTAAAQGESRIQRARTTRRGLAVAKVLIKTVDALRAMIPPVQTIPVRGRAQSSPVKWEGRTGPDHRLAILDCTGLV